jgi:Protein of unknown function (DUF3168).
MSTIFERVDDALASISPAVNYAMAPYKGTLPDQYVVYQMILGSPEQHADDAETERSYSVQVTIWSRSGLVSVPDIDTAMIAAGFKKSNERQLPQDPQTGHYGLAKEFVIFN